MLQCGVLWGNLLFRVTDNPSHRQARNKQGIEFHFWWHARETLWKWKCGVISIYRLSYGDIGNASHTTMSVACSLENKRHFWNHGSQLIDWSLLLDLEQVAHLESDSGDSENDWQPCIWAHFSVICSPVGFKEALYELAPLQETADVASLDSHQLLWILMVKKCQHHEF